MHHVRSSLFLVLLSFFGRGQSLTLTETSTRLPTRLYSTRAVYDGDDKIYLLGGTTYINLQQAPTDQILEYSISNETITLAGNLPTPISSGSVVWNGNGSVYYFGGFARDIGQNQDVWEFTPGSRVIRVAGRLPSESSSTGAAWDGVDNAYILPGSGSPKVVRFTQSTGNAVLLPTENLWHFGSSVAWDSNGAVAYAFGGSYETYMTSIYRFNPALNTMERLPVRMPWAATNTGAVFDGYNIIVLGGYNRDPSVPVEFTGVAKFDPLVMSVASLNVPNFPNQYYGFGTVYVPKLRRVYIFGGHSTETLGTHDKISYIQFS